MKYIPGAAIALTFLSTVCSFPALAATANPTQTKDPGSVRMAQTQIPVEPAPAPAPVRSNTSDRTALQRAKNLARMAAERANGGLGQYRAESAMHGPALESPFVDNGNGSWTFTFQGGEPGHTTPTVETVVTVYRDDWRVVVEYNGAVRSGSGF